MVEEDPRGGSVAPAWLEVLEFEYYMLGQEKIYRGTSPGDNQEDDHLS